MHLVMFCILSPYLKVQKWADFNFFLHNATLKTTDKKKKKENKSANASEQLIKYTVSIFTSISSVFLRMEVHGHAVTCMCV